ncbi:MAG: flippase-like domain-containing protein [Candidatus Aureabacteria bacterium]|nr:flippase-like domain-containing protein [Candidatus Auribacterota bacterium]
MLCRIKRFLPYFFRLVLTLFVIAVICYGFEKKLGQQEDILGQIKTHFQHIHFGWFSLALSIYFVYSFISAYRIALLTWSHDIPISYNKLLKNIYIGYLFNLFLMGSTGGDVIRSYYLTKETGKKTEVVTVVFLDRLLGMAVMVSLAIMALIFNFNEPKLRFLITGVLSLFFIMMVVILFFSSRRIMKRFAFLIPLLDKLKIKEIAIKTFETLNQTKKRKKVLIGVIISTLIIQSLAIVSVWLVSLSMMKIHFIPLRYFFLFLPVIYTISSVPISVGGLGVGEALFAGLFAIVGVNQVDAISISLLSRSILIIGALVGAVIYLLPSTVPYSEEEKEQMGVCC